MHHFYVLKMKWKSGLWNEKENLLIDMQLQHLSSIIFAVVEWGVSWAIDINVMRVLEWDRVIVSYVVGVVLVVGVVDGESAETGVAKAKELRRCRCRKSWSPCRLYICASIPRILSLMSSAHWTCDYVQKCKEQKWYDINEKYAYKRL